MRRGGFALATLSDCRQKPPRSSNHDDLPNMKAMRGTRRVCQACATRFYDLSRDPIVCPSCGARYVPEAPAPVAETGPRAAGSTGKSSWRSRRVNRPGDPGTEPHADPEPDGAPEVAAVDDAPEEGPARMRVLCPMRSRMKPISPICSTIASRTRRSASELHGLSSVAVQVPEACVQEEGAVTLQQ
jgi:uncharacterized protein (TIGR02300 family)